jgi:hypothetical protein
MVGKEPCKFSRLSGLKITPLSCELEVRWLTLQESNGWTGLLILFGDPRKPREKRGSGESWRDLSR